MRRRSATPRPTLLAEEVEGFLAGVDERLKERRRAGNAETELEARWTRARDLVARGALRDAETELLTIDARLDEREEESELTEFPRGLVGYVPAGERGRPPTDEEDPVANRLRLIERLLDVRRHEGRDVGPLVARLAAAFTALRAGDRGLARRLGDEVHAALDAGPPGER